MRVTISAHRAPEVVPDHPGHSTSSSHDQTHTYRRCHCLQWYWTEFATAMEAASGDGVLRPCHLERAGGNKECSVYGQENMGEHPRKVQTS